jgi:hypothetical protein
VPSHDVKVGVWCAMSATRVIGFFCRGIANSCGCVTLSTQFFQQDSTVARTVNTLVESLFGDKIGNYVLYARRTRTLAIFTWGRGA